MRKATRVRVKAEVRLPAVPNFLLMAGGGEPLCLCDVPERELRRIGRAWVEALVERSREQASGVGLRRDGETGGAKT